MSSIAGAFMFATITADETVTTSEIASVLSGLF